MRVEKLRGRIERMSDLSEETAERYRNRFLQYLCIPISDTDKYYDDLVLQEDFLDECKTNKEKIEKLTVGAHRGSRICADKLG